jgi:hypothetical protein
MKVDLITAMPATASKVSSSFREPLTAQLVSIPVQFAILMTSTIVWAVELRDI